MIISEKEKVGSKERWQSRLDICISLRLCFLSKFFTEFDKETGACGG